MSLLAMTDEEQNELALLERGTNYLYQEECSEGTSEIVSQERDEHFMKLGQLQWKQMILDAIENDSREFSVDDAEVVYRLLDLLRHNDMMKQFMDRYEQEEKEKDEVMLDIAKLIEESDRWEKQEKEANELRRLEDMKRYRETLEREQVEKEAERQKEIERRKNETAEELWARLMKERAMKRGRR